jgi:two-component system sensor histidine kinase UhpB
MPEDPNALRILDLEDDPLDTELIQANLAEGGIACEIIRVETRTDFEAALENGVFDLVLSDYSLPSFDGLSALKLAKEIRPEVPFVLVSGAIGEERAIEALKSGATDYVLKQRLERLVPAVRRAVREAEERTERKRAEEELRNSRDQLEIILRGVADGITAQDPNGRLVYANEAAARIVGYSSARELIEAPLQEVMHKFEIMDEEGHPFPPEYLPGRIVLGGEEAAEVVLRFRVLATGEERWSVVTAKPVFDEQKRVRMAVNIFRDITESKRTEDALREMREAERYRLARDLHDGVLQDLSYTATAMGIVMLEAEDAGLQERLQAAIDAVRRAAEGLRYVVNDLRFEEEQDRSLPELVEYLVQRNRKMARGCEISLEVEDGFPSAPLGEVGTEMFRIIQEALTNARRHSGARSVIVSLRRVEEGELVAEVVDDGQGFGAGSAPGVGLQSMRERSAALKGLLQIDSEVGEGTRVQLRVPIP